MLANSFRAPVSRCPTLYLRLPAPPLRCRNRFAKSQKTPVIRHGLQETRSMWRSRPRTRMKKLETSSREINKVIKVIKFNCPATNLLALNATIEAARAASREKVCRCCQMR